MNTAANSIKVWDPLIRIFHWTLVVSFFTAYLTEEDMLTVHVWAGYTVLGLLVFRLIWGFIGPQYARFSSFAFSPHEILAYIKSMLAFKARRYVGHNPAGSVMIYLLLLSLLATTVSGVFLYGADQGAGPLAGMMTGVGEHVEKALEEIHEVLANLTLALVFFHILGVIAGSLLHKENLVGAMLTGRKHA